MYFYFVLNYFLITTIKYKYLISLVRNKTNSYTYKIIDSLCKIEGTKFFNSNLRKCAKWTI